MKNKKDITKITFLTCLLIGNMVSAQNFYTCMPKKSWIINVVKEEQEAERRRREEEERKRREEEERKRREEEERKRREREICLKKKDACESRKVCYKNCLDGYGDEQTFPKGILKRCRQECDYKGNEDCGTCP